MVRALPAQGIAVLNADDASVDVWRDVAGGSVARIEFALDAPAACTAIYGRCRWRRAATQHARTGAHRFVSPRPDVTTRPMHWQRRRAALAVGVPLDAAVRGLEAFRPVAGRLCAEESEKRRHHNRRFV
jgi:UDP-N-acetylmuramoyl-tripeptide--D-alanyl-D-alanine ligase